MGGTTWFEILFLFTFFYSCKFLRKLTPILQKLIEQFVILFITAFVFLPPDGIHTDEQQRNDYNSRSDSPILMKLVVYSHVF